MKELEDYLWSLSVSALCEHKKKMGIVGCKDVKYKMIDRIMEIYKKEGWLEEYFQTLEGFDKAHAYLIVQHNFNPSPSDVRMLIFKYNTEIKFRGEIKDNLKFVIKGYVPTVFRERLKALVPKVEISFQEVDVSERNCKWLINKGNSMKKFDDFLIFITKNKIKVTNANSFMSKSSMFKFVSEFEIEEIPVNYDFLWEEVKNQKDTVVVNGIISLLLAASVIEISDGYFSLGSNYLEYVNKSEVEKGIFLLNKYLESRSINEIKCITNYLFKVDGPIMLQNSRQRILEYVRELPIDKWVRRS